MHDGVKLGETSSRAPPALKRAHLGVASRAATQVIVMPWPVASLVKVALSLVCTIVQPWMWYVCPAARPVMLAGRHDRGPGPRAKYRTFLPNRVA